MIFKFKKNNLLLLLLVMVTLFTPNVLAYDYYPDDIYDGNYSLEEMLKNYSVITFGKKEVDSQFQQQTGLSKGDVNLFHINSQFLINGKLTNNNDDIRVDFRNGKNSLKSYVNNTDRNLYCGNGSLDSCNKDSTLYSTTQFNYADKSTIVGNYMNFDRLYEKIVDSQSRIPKGKALPNIYADNIFILDNYLNDYDNNIASYYIDKHHFENNTLNIIQLMNYQDMKDKLIIITIDAPGTIIFPRLIYYYNLDVSTGVMTNDYYGMERPNNDYANFFVPELYNGNIIWNIPNATRIELPSWALVGHVIAPNADIISPENQFAGAMIANSISFAGNSEAHFYPLQIDNLPYISSLDYHNVDYKLDESRGTLSYSEGLNPQELQEGMVVKFKVNAKLGYQVSNIIIKDEEGNIIEYRKVSDDEYEFTMPATNVMINPTFEKKEVIDLITNPETGLKISVFLIAIISLGTGIYVYQKKESKKI